MMSTGDKSYSTNTYFNTLVWVSSALGPIFKLYFQDVLLVAWHVGVWCYSCGHIPDQVCNSGDLPIVPDYVVGQGW